MKYQKLLCRIVLYAVGLLILAFGVAFSVNSNLGVSPINSLPYVSSRIIGFDMGTCVVAVFLMYILVQIAILRKEFKWIDLSQIFFSSLFGYFVDFSKRVLGDFSIPTYAGQLIMLAISIVFVAIGVATYMEAKLVNMPMEGMILAIVKKLPKLAFHNAKIILDCFVVIIAAILSLVFLGGLYGVREGTVLCALLVGRLMGPIQKVLRPTVHKICFG
jgi:uncharacterized membrane protein YczE